MIDWITARVAILQNHLPMGHIIKSTHHGELEWATAAKLSPEGSHSMTVRIRSLDDVQRGVLLEIDGNPLKFLQGHNLFGSNNIRGLIRGVVNRISTENPDFEIPLMQPTITYDIELRRIDATIMYDVGTDTEVEQTIDYLERYARSRFGKGHPKKHMLLFQKGSRRWSMNYYNKYQEIKKHQLPRTLSERNDLIEYSKGKLRKEIRLLKMEIDRIDSDFLPSDIPNIIEKYSEKIKVSDTIEVDNGTLKTLSRTARLALVLWKQGEDVKSALGVAESTFYRHRKQLLESFNIDIAIRNTSALDRKNIIPFRKVLTLKPCPEVPEFAKGTDLYYDADENTDQLQLL